LFELLRLFWASRTLQRFFSPAHSPWFVSPTFLSIIFPSVLLSVVGLTLPPPPGPSKKETLPRPAPHDVRRYSPPPFDFMDGLNLLVRLIVPVLPLPCQSVSSPRIFLVSISRKFPPLPHVRTLSSMRAVTVLIAFCVDGPLLSSTRETTAGMHYGITFIDTLLTRPLLLHAKVREFPPFFFLIYSRTSFPLFLHCPPMRR